MSHKQTSQLRHTIPAGELISKTFGSWWNPISKDAVDWPNPRDSLETRATPAKKSNTSYGGIAGCSNSRNPTKATKVISTYRVGKPKGATWFKIKQIDTVNLKTLGLGGLHSKKPPKDCVHFVPRNHDFHLKVLGSQAWSLKGYRIG